MEKIMCEEDDCSNQAVGIIYWPGQEVKINLCQKHISKCEEIGNALGLKLITEALPNFVKLSVPKVLL